LPYPVCLRDHSLQQLSQPSRLPVANCLGHPPNLLGSLNRLTWHETVPLVVNFDLGPSLGDAEVLSGSPDPNGPFAPPKNSMPLSHPTSGTSNSPLWGIVIERSADSRLFVYSITLIPALFILLLLLLIWPSYTGRRREAQRDVLLPLAAVVFTILPLHQILVPSEIQGITRVDVILGIEMVLAVAIVPMLYGVDTIREGLRVWGRSRTRHRRIGRRSDEHEGSSDAWL